MKAIVFLNLALAVLYFGCSDKVTSPREDIYGVQGRVIDTSGSAISGASIYCLFDYGFIPDTSGYILEADHPLTDSIFNNGLEQNFPNPFSYYNYIRFSLHQESAVELEFSSDASPGEVLLYRDTLHYGWYQRYIAPGINSNFKNGPCRYMLRIFPLTGESITFEKEGFLISDKNKPNSISGSDGYYLFNYDDAFINDTVKELYDPRYVYDHVISDNITLLVKKEGYVSRYVSLTLLRSVLYNQDIILKKGEEQ